MNNKEIREGLENLVFYQSRGGGFGDPDAQREHESQIEHLKHK